MYNLRSTFRLLPFAFVHPPYRPLQQPELEQHAEIVTHRGVFRDPSIPNAKAVEMEHLHPLARRRDANQHAAEDLGQRRPAEMGAGHRDLAHDAVARGGLFLDPVVKVGEHAEQSFEHPLHPRPPDRAAVVLRVSGIERRSSSGIASVQAFLVEPAHQRGVAID